MFKPTINRLRENIVLEENGICTWDSLWAHYATFCDDTGNQSLSTSALKLLIPSIFSGKILQETNYIM